MDANVIKKIIGDLFRTRFETPMPCDVLTFACDTDRSVIIDGKAYSPIIDTIEFALSRARFEVQQCRPHCI